MRMFKWTTGGAVLALALALLPGQAVAQNPSQQRGMMGQGMTQMCSMMSGQGMMGGRGMMGGQGMTGMTGIQMGPAALLAVADQLALNDDQVARLDALEDQSSEEHAAHMRAAVQAQQQASQILVTKEPDLDAYRRALDEAADHMVMAHMTLTRAAVEALAVLTEDQKALVEDGMTLMRHMMCGMGDR